LAKIVYTNTFALPTTAIAVLLFLIVFFGTTSTLRAMKREAVEF